MSVGFLCSFNFSLASVACAVIFVSLFFDPELVMKTILCVVCAFVLSGCVSSAEETWPKITIEMRVLLVDEHFIEEFGPDTSRDVPGFPDLTPPEAFVRPIDEIDAKLLVTAALASQNCRSLTAPRVTFLPGGRARVFFGRQVSFISDLSPMDESPHTGGFTIDVSADFERPGAQDGPLRLVMHGKEIPRGIDSEDELAWESYGEQARVELYPGVTFRAQAVCDSGTTYLIALPTPVDVDGKGIQRVLVLVRPMVLTSREQEDELYPGLAE